VARSISGWLTTGGVEYGHIVATQDHHIDPGSHFSDHPDYVDSWPPHCVVGSPGAEFHPDLAVNRVETAFRKGEHRAAYSGFEGVDPAGTPLADWLRERGVTEVDIAGIATDHCVRATTGDAVRAGFGTRVLLGLTAGVAPDTTARALTEMRDAGAELDGIPILIS
jgi:nicotinamidase/pyrazinamidase